MATSNRIRALNRLPFDFQDGLKVGGVDVTALNQTFTPAGAGLVGFTPVGGLSATNVQAAIAELDTEKARWDTLATSAGAGLIGYFPAGTSAVATTVQSKLRESVSVKDFGLDSTKSGAENKAAIQAAINSLTRPTRLKIPSGYFNIESGIQLRALVFSIEGEGKYETFLGCNTGASETAVFSLPDTTTVEYLTLKDFGISCAGRAGYAIRMAKANHCTFDGLLVNGATSSAIFVGGYSNDIVNCDLFSNTGSGIELSGTLNNVNIRDNKIYANSGIGIFAGTTDIDAGLNVNISGNAIEQNAVAGIVAFNIKALNITQNYFERNSVTGYRYGVPEVRTISADIHVLGYPGAQIGAQDLYGVKQCVIDGNHCTPKSVYSELPNPQSFVFTSYANGMRVTNNNIFDAAKVDSLVLAYYNKNSSKVVGELLIEGNTVNSIDFEADLIDDKTRFSTAHLISAPENRTRGNYASQNLLTDWAVYSGSSGSWEKSLAVYQGMPVWAMGDGDFLFGYAIDLTKNLELKGKWVYFGMWVNTQGSLTNAQLVINGNASSGDTEYDNDSLWKFKSTCEYISPSATSFFIGVRKVGTGADLLISSPICSLVGNFYSGAKADYPEWKRAFYPIEGCWEVGQRVINYPPVVGQPKAWVCTIAGTPGTWVSEGNL